ncbi:hypothetical protein I7I48_11818 [Histoplasma ohiense]|nr:hypothetical protein I7I48_11818 [Histoplasma ohiense (nom. inval.)]
MKMTKGLSARVTHKTYGICSSKDPLVLLVMLSTPLKALLICSLTIYPINPRAPNNYELNSTPVIKNKISGPTEKAQETLPHLATQDPKKQTTSSRGRNR